MAVSRYPGWLMYLVAPTETKQWYQQQQGGGEDSHTEAKQPQPQPQPAVDGGLHVGSTTPRQLPPSQQQLLQPAAAQSVVVELPQASRTQQLQPQPPPSSSSSRRRVHPQRSQQEQDAHDLDKIVRFCRRLFAEFLGSAIFIFLVAGVALEFNLCNRGIDRTPQARQHRTAAAQQRIALPAQAVPQPRLSAALLSVNQTGAGYASGLSLAFLVYSMGEVSGAHFNPIVTWAFTLRGLFPVVWLPCYWLVQFCGSLLAGGFLHAFYWQYAYLGTTEVNPAYQWVTGFCYEAVLTFIFMSAVLAVATRSGNVGPHAALADGFVFAVCVMIGLSYTGTSVNPFRALGPGIVNGYRPDLWVYVAGPFLGSTAAVLAVWALNGPLKPEDFGAVQGKGQPQKRDEAEQDDKQL